MLIIMKNKILLFYTLIISSGSFAQHVQFGAGAGVDNYRISGGATANLRQLLSFANGTISTKPVTGFYAGGFASVPLSDAVSIEPGLYYSSKGYQLTGSYTVKGLDILSANASSKLQTNYIDMPVLVKANFNGLQIFAGPQLSYLTNASLNTNASVAGFTLYHNKADVTSKFNNWDIGLTGGVGYQLANGMRITAVYDRGLSKADAGQNMKSYNQGFKVGLGFQL
jgi:Outer membrane protein beta-barrel domain